MLIGAGLLLRRAKLQVKQAKQTRAQRVVVAADATRRNALAAAVLAVPLLLAVPQPAKAGLVRWAAAGTRRAACVGWRQQEGERRGAGAAESCTRQEGAPEGRLRVQRTPGPAFDSAPGCTRPR